MNRVGSGQFADSICGVVYQPKQFSFIESRTPRRSASTWQTAVAIARIARDRAFRQVAPEALFFHANYAKPSWRTLKQKVTAVGAHIFYR
jgi:spore germination cell wall hydrolase CwlJ-like protein